MIQNNFQQRKTSILEKKDKSFKGNWDKKIIPLCKKINSKKYYYTTSSCGGRDVLIIDKEKKQKGLFLKVYHNLIDFKKLKNDLTEISKKNKNVNFKQEPSILHVACSDLKSAENLLKKARSLGLKRSGIISGKNKFILEIMGTEKLEFPIIKNNQILVSDEFLKIVVKEANKNLKKTWKKINKLKEVI